VRLPLLKEKGQVFMSRWYTRYMEGHYRAVYEELCAIGEHVFDDQVEDEAVQVARAMMRRVRRNAEVLVARLREVGYRFGAGFLDELTAEERLQVEQDAPMLGIPARLAPERIEQLEHLVGTLPLSLRCWYEEVGSINLIGLFPAMSPETGMKLDPLFIYSLEVALRMGNLHGERDPTLSLSPDNAYKYGYGGDAPYSVKLPSKSFDVPLLYEPHQGTLVDYLRVCFLWGGFPGLEYQKNVLPGDILPRLTEGLLPF